MSKQLHRLIVILVLFCGIFALVATSYAMMKSTGIARKPGDALGSIVVVRDDGNNWYFEWSYDEQLNTKSLAVTKVNINLYQNGKFLRTIAEKVPIGQNGQGSWNWKATGGPDDGEWLNGKDYRIEIVISSKPNLKASGAKFAIE